MISFRGYFAHRPHLRQDILSFITAGQTITLFPAGDLKVFLVHVLATCVVTGAILSANKSSACSIVLPDKLIIKPRLLASLIISLLTSVIRSPRTSLRTG